MKAYTLYSKAGITPMLADMAGQTAEGNLCWLDKQCPKDAKPAL